MENSKQVFFTVSLPRSGTAWLANYFTYGPSYCYHEPCVDCSSLDDLCRKIDNTPRKIVGVADTMVPLFIPKIAKRYPSAKYIIITRPEDDVRLSLFKAGFNLNGFEHMKIAFESATKYINDNVPYVAQVREQHFSNLFKSGLPLWQFITKAGGNKFRDKQLIDTRVEIIPQALGAKFNRERNNSLLKEMELYQPQGSEDDSPT